MADYSYNDLKQEFETSWEGLTPPNFPPFQRPLGDNTSNADSKIYTKAEWRRMVSFFIDQRTLNPFCDRINCWNVNRGHSHAHPENKSEYVTKIVKILEEWQTVASNENRLDQNELNQLTQLIKVWKDKNSIEVQKALHRKHWEDTVFSNWRPFTDTCWNIIDELVKKIKDGKITDDTNQPDPNDFVLCDACKLKKTCSYSWEKNFRRELENNCRAGTHLQDISKEKSKIHNKCWRKIKENNFQDIDLSCGCSSAKSSELLELTPTNLVKSFFVLKNVKSIKSEGDSELHIIDPFIRVKYLDGRDQLIHSSDPKIVEYNNLVTYLRDLPSSQRTKEITRRDLGIVERDDPDNDKDLEESRIKLLNFFKKEGIRSVILRGDKLVIKYKNREGEEEKEPDSTELNLVQSYCQAKGIDFLTLSDLERSNTRQPRNIKPLFYAGVAAVIVLVIAVISLIAYLAYQNGKNNRRR